MGVDDMGDAHLCQLGLFDEPVFVTGHHVHRRGKPLAGAAEKVGQRGVFGEKLFEKHVLSSVVPTLANFQWHACGLPLRNTIQ